MWTQIRVTWSSPVVSEAGASGLARFDRSGRASACSWHQTWRLTMTRQLMLSGWRRRKHSRGSSFRTVRTFGRRRHKPTHAAQSALGRATREHDPSAHCAAPLMALVPRPPRRSRRFATFARGSSTGSLPRSSRARSNRVDDPLFSARGAREERAWSRWRRLSGRQRSAGRPWQLQAHRRQGTRADPANERSAAAARAVLAPRKIHLGRLLVRRTSPIPGSNEHRSTCALRTRTCESPREEETVRPGSRESSVRVRQSRPPSPARVESPAWFAACTRCSSG